MFRRTLDEDYPRTPVKLKRNAIQFEFSGKATLGRGYQGQERELLYILGSSAIEIGDDIAREIEGRLPRSRVQAEIVFSRGSIEWFGLVTIEVLDWMARVNGATRLMALLTPLVRAIVRLVVGYRLQGQDVRRIETDIVSATAADPWDLLSTLAPVNTLLLLFMIALQILLISGVF